MIFLGVMVFSIAAAAMIVLGEYSGVAKLFAAGLVGISLVLQWAPEFGGVHFLVPLFMQLIVCLWWAVASQFG